VELKERAKKLKELIKCGGDDAAQFDKYPQI